MFTPHPSLIGLLILDTQKLAVPKVLAMFIVPDDVLWFGLVYPEVHHQKYT